MGEMPPPYAPQQAPRAKNTNALLIVLGLLGVCCIGTVVLGFFGFNLFKSQLMPIGGCMINFQAASEAVQAYSSTHDGKFPDAKTWQDDVAKYYDQSLQHQHADKKDTPAFLKVPGARDDWGCFDGPNKKTGMAFNSELSGKKVTDIKNPFETIMLFEVVRTGRNLSEPYRERPLEGSPKMLGAPRGWITVQANGHVNMGKNGKINFNASSGG